MQIKKLMVCASVLMLVSSASMVGQAADQEGHEADHAKDKAQKATDTKPDTKAPIVIEADNLSFSDETGDVFANGNVVVKQNTDVILTDAMRGNQKTTEVWVDGQATLQQPGTNLVGTHTHYNYTTKLGNMQEMKGIVGKDHISGDNVELSPGKLVAYDATSTRCPAIVPDYHMSADRIEIWPGDKMIAYNAKMWIKNMVIYSMPKYQKSLNKEDNESAFPRVGYRSKDGAYLTQHLEYPISDNLAAFTDLGIYSKSGFKPIYGVVDKEKSHKISLVQGEYRDDNDNWIKKEPEVKFELYSKRLGNLPVSYTFNTSYGKWTDDTKSSWHQETNLYFSHDTITLGKGLFLGLGTGIQRIHESYNDVASNSWRFDTALTKQWSPRFTTTTEYHYINNQVSVFDYNTADMAREFDVGFTYKIDRMNTVGYRQSYDLENDRIYDQDYTWYRNLHCWQAAITYRAKRHQINFDLSTTRW
jgi:lipopolysaccharide assembly outer membrane protein LptD (OstA)